MDLIDTYKTFHSNIAKYPFFSHAHGLFSRTDYILQHKTISNKFKKIKIIPSIVSNQNGVKQNKTKKWTSKRLEKSQYMKTEQHATEAIKISKKKMFEKLKISENENMKYKNL